MGPILIALGLFLAIIVLNALNSKDKCKGCGGSGAIFAPPQYGGYGNLMKNTQVDDCPICNGNGRKKD